MKKDFSGLQSDRAYKTGAYVSGFILFWSLFFDSKILNNQIISAFSASFFVYFISIWLGISKKDYIRPGGPTGYLKVGVEAFKATVTCKIFIVISIILFLLGTYLTVKLFY